MFSIRGLRLYFPELEPWVAQSASLPHRSSWFICTQCGTTYSVGLSPAWSSSHCLAVHPLCPGCPYLPLPPASLDECFFLNSLVVGLPYSLIFCQCWLFFVFKLLSFFWLCKEAQCVYLRLHVGWKTGILEEQLYNPNMESLMPFLLVFKTS